MRYLSLINVSDPDNEVIISQIKTDLTDEQAIDLESFLKENNILSDKFDLCITEDCE